MKTLLLALSLTSLAAAAALADPPFVSNPDLSCMGCASSSGQAFGYSTYAGQRGLVTTVQTEQAKENAIKQYATSSQAPKDEVAAMNQAALAKQRGLDRVIGRIELTAVIPQKH